MLTDLSPAVTFQTMNKFTIIFTSVREQAFDWYAALQSRDRIQELWPSFEEWLKNPHHKETYLWIEQISADARDLAESCEESSDYQPTHILCARRHSRRSWPLNGLESTGRITVWTSRAWASSLVRGRIYGHLARTTRSCQQRKGRNPIQTCDWAPAGLIEDRGLDGDDDNK